MSLNRTDFEVKQRIAALPPIVRAQLTEILEEILNGSTQRNFSCATLIAGATALSGNVSLGESGDGVDLTAFGDTAGKYFKWDAATDSFILVGDLAVNTDKFTVDHATGNTVVGGTLDSTGDLTVGADKFNVDAGTGDTQIDGTLGVDGQATTAYEVGAKAGIPEFAVVEEGMGGFHKTILTLTDVPLTVSDDAGVGQWAAHLLYTFPTGLTHILGATANLDLSLEDDADCTWADPTVGTFGVGVTVMNDASIAGTQENIIAETAFSLPKTATTVTGPLHGKSAALVVDDGTTTGGLGDTALYLNIAAIPEVAAQAATTGTVSGTVTLLWASAGDF